jgi:CHASE3 domain sensor protein
MSSRLNEQDQDRVKQYLSTPQHQVERQAFKPWRLLLVIVTVVIGLGILSRLLSHLVH